MGRVCNAGLTISLKCEGWATGYEPNRNSAGESSAKEAKTVELDR